MPQEDVRRFLRHTLATVAYRGGKALRDVPPHASSIEIGDPARTPLQILAHINDLFDWAVGLARGEHVWNDSTPMSWEEEVARFYDGLRRFDDALASDAPLGFPAERIFQGPIADALTHIGQIAMLRRIAGAPMRGENYFQADIEAGRVGREQAAPRREF
jgi:hypothetical protein